MTDIKEAHGLEVFTVPGRYLAVNRKNPGAQDVVLLSETQAVIDQLRERVAELDNSRTFWAKKAIALAAELAATKEHLHTVEPEFRSLQATRNMAEKTVETMIRRAESAEEELAALKSAPVVMPDRRIQALAGVSLFDLGHAKGWNACLDKFESLNRSKT